MLKLFRFLNISILGVRDSKINKYHNWQNIGIEKAYRCSYDEIVKLEKFVSKSNRNYYEK